MKTARSTRRLEYPHSLSYHEMTLWKVSLRAMHAVASMIDERLSWTKSWETTAWSVYPRTPFNSPSEAALRVARSSSLVQPFLSLTVRSTMETSGVGQRTAIPVRTPFNSGITFPTALAAPVEEGIRLATAALMFATKT